ncbi:MAG: hypothetical protein WD768_18080, partial [Phycisphaeraceae bacterium]
ATAAVLLLHLLVSLARGKGERRPRWAILTKLIYLGTVITVLILGVTSFYSVLDHGAMHGWFLLLHVASAGGFVVCLMLIAIIWAMPSQFCFGSTPARPAEPGTPRPVAKFGSLTKLSYWLILISGLVTAGTMLISMLPLLGTESLLQMITLHRYAGLLLVVATLVHLYTVFLGKLGRA